MMQQQQTNDDDSSFTTCASQLVNELFQRLDSLDRDANQLGADIEALPDDDTPPANPNQLFPYRGLVPIKFGRFHIPEPLTAKQRENLGGMEDMWMFRRTTRVTGKTKGRRDETIKLPVAVFVREGNQIKRTRTVRSNKSLQTLLHNAKTMNMTVCKSAKKMVVVRSETDPSQTYRLGFDLATSSWQCNCMGYHYRATCKHTKAVN